MEKTCPAKFQATARTGAALLTKDSTRSKRKDSLAASDDMQGRVKSNRFYGSHKAGRALDHFMRWSDGAVESKMLREILRELHVVTDRALLVEQSAEQHAARAGFLFASMERKQCHERSPPARLWSLLDRKEIDGIEHVVLRSDDDQGPRLQYLVVLHEQVIVADPPVACLVRKDPDLHVEDIGGGDSNLDLNDPMTKDCKQLFERTAMENCGKKFKLNVISATLQIIDGFEVNMDAEVVGQAGKRKHSLECLFETSTNHTDASLLQQQTDPAETNTTEAEKAGLVGTLRMQTDLCDADVQDGPGTSFEQHVALGELSLYKGYEHVNDELPPAHVQLGEEAPSEVDHRKIFPKCFRLRNGKEAVRNQGGCGSCWGFAFASAAMNNLCHSNGAANSLASIDDRFEVSVQQIMSCNKGKKGCNGGNAAAAHTGIVKSNGLSKERDYKYRCGSGNPANHFEKDSGGCKSAPWGAKCASNSAVPGWMYAGVSSVTGEKDIMTLLSKGHSLYMRMDVYQNFMTHRGGVYTSLKGRKKGGHAMASVGYGNEGGHKYWLLQNSWGPGGWGVDGYGKVVRGKNLAGIEKAAYWVKAWVSGGKQPECTDGKSTSLSSGGRDITCKMAQGGGYGDLCKHGQFGDVVRANCPVTCGSCLVVGKDNGGKPAPAPGPGPPQTSAPALPMPNPAPPSPFVNSSCLKDATSLFSQEFQREFKCAVWNTCNQDLTLKCTGSACTQTLGRGGVYLLKCNGKVSTHFCTNKSQCDVAAASASAPAPPPPPPLPGKKAPSKSWQKEVLAAHNLYRCMHGVPLMNWNTDIAKAAQDWADETRGAMQHSPKSKRSNIGGHGYLGENLAMGRMGAGAVKMWYDEIGLTNPRGIVKSFSGGTGHYTQVVWKASLDLGCGQYERTTVCMYGPGGNMMNGFQANVLAPTKTEAECRKANPPVPSPPTPPPPAARTPTPSPPAPPPPVARTRRRRRRRGCPTRRRRGSTRRRRRGPTRRRRGATRRRRGGTRRRRGSTRRRRGSTRSRSRRRRVLRRRRRRRALSPTGGRRRRGCGGSGGGGGTFRRRRRRRGCR